jgi:hypothetical protein
MTSAQRADDKYSEEEAQRRLEAALRGARLAGHKPMKSMTPKRASFRHVTRCEQSDLQRLAFE